MSIGWYIEHSAGESLVKGNPLIHTYQSPCEYFVERTSDLNTGSRIPVEAIKKELEDLEPLFLKRLRYSNAHAELHYVNSKGMSVKKFRVLLLRGLTQKLGLTQDADLERRIMQEDLDFNRADYDRFVDEVYSLRPTARSQPMAHDSLYWWFTKNTGLEDWENFNSLATINPEFKAIYESYGKEEGYHAADRMYTGVRRHLRKRMESDKPFKLPERDKTKTRTKLQEEIDVIGDMIFAEYDNYFKAAILTKIIPIETQEQWDRFADRLGDSAVKVYTGKPRVKSYREVDITDLLNAESVLKECWGEAIYRYFEMVHNVNLSMPKMHDKPFLEIAGYFVLKVTDMLVDMSPVENQMLNSPHPLIKKAFDDNGGKLLSDDKQQLLDSIVEVFIGDFKSGKSEEMLRLPRYSLSDMTDALSSVRSSVPRSYYEWEKLESDITRLIAVSNPGDVVFRGRFSSIFTSESKLERGLVRELQRELPKLEQQSRRLWEYLVREYNIGKKKRFLQESLDPITLRGDIALLLTEKMIAVQRGEIFFKREDVAGILEKFGFGPFIKYIRPRNFI